MAGSLPVEDVSYPTALCGHENGKLPDSLLESVPGPAGGPMVRLVKPAARAWRAMSAAAKTAGFRFKVFGPEASYRTFEQQLAVFRNRYSDTPIAGAPARCWQNKPWWLKPGFSHAAVPGTSNHGLGLAVDIGLENDNDPQADDITDEAVAWLVNNARRFGFSAELQSEPWHWRYWAGDNVPVAVTAFEGDGHESVPASDIHTLLSIRDAEIAKLRTALREVTKALT